MRRLGASVLFAEPPRIWNLITSTLRPNCSPSRIIAHVDVFGTPRWRSANCCAGDITGRRLRESSVLTCMALGECGLTGGVAAKSVATSSISTCGRTSARGAAQQLALSQQKLSRRCSDGQGRPAFQAGYDAGSIPADGTAGRGTGRAQRSHKPDQLGSTPQACYEG